MIKKHTLALGVAMAALAGGAASAIADEPIQPIEPVKEVNLALAELGKKLYFDPRLSKSGFISCNSCHNLSMGGTDNLKTSIGHNWQQGPINAPTVLNSSLNVAQFWDGRAADLKAQAGGPIANPGEMAFTHTLAVERAGIHPGLRHRVQAGVRHRRHRYRQGHRGHRRVRKDAGDAELALRPVAAGQRRRHHRRGAGRLRAVQEQRLRRLPQRSGRGRQLLPEDGRGRALHRARVPPRA